MPETHVMIRSKGSMSKIPIKLSLTAVSHYYMCICIIDSFSLHLILGKSDKGRPCQPIFKVQWLAVSSG